MNFEVKKEWLEALRSGKYQQGNQELRTVEGRFCCLGVLCDLYSRKFQVPWDERKFQRELSYPPMEVRMWAGLEHEDPMIPSVNHSLSYLNDDGKTFDEIAKYIEEEL